VVQAVRLETEFLERDACRVSIGEMSVEKSV
jgi:hypothetical protein